VLETFLDDAFRRLAAKNQLSHCSKQQTIRYDADAHNDNQLTDTQVALKLRPTMFLSALALPLALLALVSAQDGLCPVGADGLTVASWTFEPGFTANTTAVTPSSVTMPVHLNGGDTRVTAATVAAMRGQACADVVVVGSTTPLLLEPELQLSKAAVAIRVVLALSAAVTDGIIMSVSYVPSSLSVTLDQGRLALVRRTVTEERDRAMVSIEPDDWRVLTLWLTAKRASLFVDRDLVASIGWDFAGVGGIGGDSTLGFQIGRVTGDAAPMLVHSVSMQCRLALTPPTVDEVLALINPARQACPRLRSPRIGVSDVAPPTTTTRLQLATVGEVTQSGGPASDAPAPAASAPDGLPGWLIGAIAGGTALVVVVAAVAGWWVVNRMRRERMARVAAAIAMERQSVRRPGSSGSASTVKPAPAAENDGYTHAYSTSVDLVESLNDK
jgi:hypothetical protein